MTLPTVPGAPLPSAMLSETFLTYGQAEPPAALIPLRAGPLTMLYDTTSGFVRQIKLGEREILRGIYAAVRDRNWGTVPVTIREIARQVENQSFRVEFVSEHRQGDIHLVWCGTLRGAADGTLRYEFDGEAKTTFLRNRIGFCVLHPIRECAGVRARQTRTDGSVVEGRFPELIEPQIFGQSSFRDLRAVAHEVAEGLWAEVEIEGETFEMEDQRNWTDASFKTYCTPLARTFPVEVKAGSGLRQLVTLRLVGSGPRASAAIVEVGPNEPQVIQLALPAAPTTRLPAIGLGVACHGAPLSEHEVNKLSQLQLSHLRVDVTLARGIWPAKLTQAALEAEQLGARLELATHLLRQGMDDAIVAQALQKHVSQVGRVLALREGEVATSRETMARVRKLLGRSSVPLGAGSDCNFCELNREHALGRLALNEADFLFWSVNPQVHAFDHLSLVETLEAQAATVNSARAFAAGRPLAVTPITLKQRFNPVATGSEPDPSPGELPSQVDPRQLSLFGAAWTLGSIAVLASAGVSHATYYETTGWRGVMEQAAGSPLPEKFPSVPGESFPLFDILAALAGFQAAAVMPSAGPVTVLALFRAGVVERILLGNLSQTPQRVRLSGVGQRFTIWELNATTPQPRPQVSSPQWSSPLLCPEVGGEGVMLSLPPFGLSRLDLFN
jgi:D-apionolactonase